MKTFKYLFGPVPSRRFGRSLGIDLLPRKTCTADCVFCEVGRTTNRTVERREYVPIGEVIAELDEWQRLGAETDFITLAGSGEPTLHARFGEVLAAIRRRRFRSALLTSGTLFFLPEVRRAAAGADVVKASLSAWDQKSFVKICRPHPDLQFDAILAGLKSFRREFGGEFWLEVFLVPGLNSSVAKVKAIAALARDLRPDRIQLNTAVRPTAEAGVAAVPEEQMRELAALFEPPAEICAAFAADPSAAGRAEAAAILAMLQRRPCTLRDITAAFAIKADQVAPVLEALTRRGLIRHEDRAGDRYYLGV